MSWKQNKFLIGFGVAMACGVGTLGWFLFQSYSQYSDLSTTYEGQAQELQQLQTQPLYPEPSNLVKLKAQKDAVSEAAETLQQQLVPMSLPLVPITAEQFQDKLRATVSAITEKARTLNVTLPKKFYLGFDQYQSQPPKTEAASALDRELRAVEIVVTTLLDNKIDAIASMTRAPLPEEEDASAPASRPTATPARPVSGGAKKAEGKTPLFTSFPFEIVFVSDQNRFRRSVNEIARNTKQFFIVRPLKVQNTRERTTSKIEPANLFKPVSTPAPTLSTSGTGGPVVSGSASGPNLRYLVGTEKLNVTLRLNMVIFASPAK